MASFSDGENTCADHVGKRMGDSRAIASIGNVTRQPLGDPQTPFGHRQQHDASIRSQATAVEIGDDGLAANRWKNEREKFIVGHGGRGVF